MKKILLALTILATVATSTNAMAWGYRGGYRGGCYGCGWIAPALIGGVIGYELARPAPVVVGPAPVVVEPAPVVVQPQVTYIQQSAPVVQAPPTGYHYVTVTDPNCNCQKTALVLN